MKQGVGPDIWLAGDPSDLQKYMNNGIKGIVTNTVVQKDLVQKYGSLTNLTKEYLNITDKKIAIEIDGNSTQELLEVGEKFTELSDQIILKIPCSQIALEAFSVLKKEGVETFCTTVFSVSQAVVSAQAGADHILPFCEPFKDLGLDPTKLVKDCYNIFKNWEDRPKITAALVRTPDVASSALRDGADGIIIFWPVYEEILKNPLTEKWNEIFMDEWKAMNKHGHLDDLPTKLNE